MKRGIFKRKVYDPNNPPVTKPRKPLAKVSKKKVKKPKAHNSSWWQKKCDNRMQDVERGMFSCCEACGGSNQVGHHYITKSLSSYLRYDWKNIIPLCHSCHFKHHIQSDASIHNTVNAKRGAEWIEYIETHRRLKQNNGILYYQEVFNSFNAK